MKRYDGNDDDKNVRLSGELTVRYWYLNISRMIKARVV